MAGIECNRPERDARTGAGAGPGAGVGSLPVCPSCGRGDEVRAVQAVFLDGHGHVREETGSGAERRTTTREVTSRLARALAPVPPAPRVSGRAVLGYLLTFVSVGTFLGGALSGHWFSASAEDSRPPYPAPGWNELIPPGREADHLFLGWTSGLALLAAVLLFAAVARALRAYRARTEPGRPAAESLWARGWYCARCSTAHFADGPALSLQEFRTRVWTAGGYGDLAEAHRAVDLTIRHGRADGG